MSTNVSGITTVANNSPELPLQASEFFLATRQFNLIHSFGAQKHFAKAFIGKTTRLSRFAPLSLQGGQLDGSGIDPKMCGVIKSWVIDLEFQAA